MEKVKILLVDDEADFLTLMKRIIGSLGYEVITASGGQEAIEAFKNEKPQILIVDYLMPDGDGIELLKKMRAIGSRRIPAIMLTAHPSVKAAGYGKELNISAIIPKESPNSDTKADLKIILESISKEV
jgi:OmpR family response regulator RpaB